MDPGKLSPQLKLWRTPPGGKNCFYSDTYTVCVLCHVWLHTGGSSFVCKDHGLLYTPKLGFHVQSYSNLERTCRREAEGGEGKCPASRSRCSLSWSVQGTAASQVLSSLFYRVCGEGWDSVSNRWWSDNLLRAITPTYVHFQKRVRTVTLLPNQTPWCTPETQQALP